jgi:hypothetical protein
LTQAVYCAASAITPTTRSQGRHPTRTSKNRLFDKEIVADPSTPALQICYQWRVTRGGFPGFCSS